jgi:hypothetical protein
MTRLAVWTTVAPLNGKAFAESGFFGGSAARNQSF